MFLRACLGCIATGTFLPGFVLGELYSSNNALIIFDSFWSCINELNLRITLIFTILKCFKLIRYTTQSIKARHAADHDVLHTL